MTTEPMTTRLVQRKGKAFPVLRPDEAQVLTWDHESDVRTALIRGLSEYLEQLEVTFKGRRPAAFKRVVQTFTDLETKVEFPGAVVYALGTGTYDATHLAAKTFYLEDGTRRALRQTSEYAVSLSVDFFANDKLEREALMSMLEDAFDPVDWMSGVRITLPSYHSARATYERISNSTEETSVDAQRRIWKGSMTIAASAPLLRRVGVIPVMRPRFEVEVSSTDDVD